MRYILWLVHHYSDMHPLFMIYNSRDASELGNANSSVVYLAMTMVVCLCIGLQCPVFRNAPVNYLFDIASEVHLDPRQKAPLEHRVEFRLLPVVDADRIDVEELHPIRYPPFEDR